MPVPKSHATVCTHPMVLVGLDFMVHVHVCMCVCVCVCVCVRCTVCQLTTSDSWELSLCLHTVVNSWHSASSIRQIIVPNHNWVINHSALFSTYGSQPPTDNPEYRIHTHTHTHTHASMHVHACAHTHTQSTEHSHFFNETGFALTICDILRFSLLSLPMSCVAMCWRNFWAVDSAELSQVGEDISPNRLIRWERPKVELSLGSAVWVGMCKFGMNAEL